MLSRRLLRSTLVMMMLTLVAMPSAFSQRRSGPPSQISAEKVVRVPLDTIKAGESDSYVVIFSNNTWEFFHPQLDTLATLHIYRHNWDTTSLFSYLNIQLSDIPEVVVLKLVE